MHGIFVPSDLFLVLSVPKSVLILLSDEAGNAQFCYLSRAVKVKQENDAENACSFGLTF